MSAGAEILHSVHFPYFNLTYLIIDDTQRNDSDDSQDEDIIDSDDDDIMADPLQTFLAALNLTEYWPLFKKEEMDLEGIYLSYSLIE